MSTDGAIGWDIGGAHLKAARTDTNGAWRAIQLPCPLWQGTQHLHETLDTALRDLGPARCHALTMSGEMVDLFPDRRAGVRAILDVVQTHIPKSQLRVYAGAAGLVELATALDQPLSIASANWRATADAVAAGQRNAILIDVGSTTTDLIPLADAHVVAAGQDDAARLRCGELLYFGVVRTPLMAFAQCWPFAGEWTGVCNELFATAADVYRLTGDLAQAADQYPAADNGVKTAAASARRLARMIGRDANCEPDCATDGAWLALAQWLKQTQIAMIEAAVQRLASRGVPGRNAPIVGAGCGDFLARDVASRLGRPYRSFADVLGLPDTAWLSTCAPAVSVAWLARRR